MDFGIAPVYSLADGVWAVSTLRYYGWGCFEHWSLDFLVTSSLGLVPSSRHTNDPSKTEDRKCSLHLVRFGLRTPCRSVVL